MTPGVDVLSGLPSPARSFASDNSAGVHPAVMEALARANTGHALAYGADRYTEAADRRFAELFGRPVDVFYTWGGTGANVVALGSLWRPGGSVVCTDMAHIHVDETAAPERIVGIKLQTVPAQAGKLTPGQIEGFTHYLGVQHHPQPCAVSITQSSEYGTLYTAAEVRAICETAHRHGMKVHMDGARIANAAAAAGHGAESLRAFTVDAGVDVISFGGTKNGMMYGEAVVYLDPSLVPSAPFVRKQAAQLPSKMRFVSAQFEALLTDDLWLQTAQHANAMARRLHESVSGLGMNIRPPEVNALFPILERSAYSSLSEWSPFYEWDPSRDEVRWMCSWDTTEEDIERFVAGLRRVLDRSDGGR